MTVKIIGSYQMLSLCLIENDSNKKAYFQYCKSCVYTTDIQGRSQNLHHFYPGMKAHWGYLGFSGNHNNRNSSGAYVPRSERENKHT